MREASQEMSRMMARTSAGSESNVVAAGVGVHSILSTVRRPGGKAER